MEFIVDFSIERGFRSFANTEKYSKNLEYYNFFVIHVRFIKRSLRSGEYIFSLIDNNTQNIIYQREIFLDIKNKRIITPNSHEDPLIEDDKHYMLCFQLWNNNIDDIKKSIINNNFATNFNSNNVSFSFANKNGQFLIDSYTLGDISKTFNYHFKKNSEIVDDYYLKTSQDCIFRVHLGHENGYYEEIETHLKAGESINFFKYLQYPYVGLQCSYENNNPEIEEKHIVVGQKSMTLTGVYNENNVDYKPLLPFNSKYQILFTPCIDKINLKDNQYAFIKEEKWTEINQLNELIDFYKEKDIIFFESSLNFLEYQYRNHLTYGLNKVYSSLYKTNKKHHIDLEVCQNCEQNAKCMQIIPSGLSLNLFKKNLMLEKNTDCDVYKLILKKCKLA